MRKVEQFGPFQFEVETMVLRRDGAILPLGRRSAAILKVLLERAGDVVAKDVLLDAAWPGRIVEESNLPVQVAKLRQMIGSHWIRTIERVGYQFVLPVTAGTSRQAAMEGSPDPFPVVCVSALDLDNDLEPGRAIRVELLAALSRFRTLRVVEERADSRLIDYRVALSLHLRADGGARAVAKLTQGDAGRVGWAQGFDVGSALTAADAIAASIHSAIEMTEIRSGPRRTGAAADAYRHYLMGRRVLNTSLADDNATALVHFMEAARLAPTNATYLSAAAEAMHHRLSVGWSPLRDDAKAVAREFAYRALELADDDAVSVALIGNTLITVDEEDFGIALCRRAFAMNPNSQLVLACALHAEHWGGSIDEMDLLTRRATSLAPDDPGQRFALGGRASVAWLAGDYQNALDWSYRSLAFGAGYSGAHWTAIASLIELGRKQDAERHLLRYVRNAPGASVHSVANGQHFADRRRFNSKLDALRRAGMPER